MKNNITWTFLLHIKVLSAIFSLDFSNIKFIDFKNTSHAKVTSSTLRKEEELGP